MISRKLPQLFPAENPKTRLATCRSPPRPPGSAAAASAPSPRQRCRPAAGSCPGAPRGPVGPDRWGETTRSEVSRWHLYLHPAINISVVVSIKFIIYSSIETYIYILYLLGCWAYHGISAYLNMCVVLPQAAVTEMTELSIQFPQTQPLRNRWKEQQSASFSVTIP